MLSRPLLSLSTFALFILVTVGAARAAGPAEDFIRTMGDRAVATVNATGISEPEREKRFVSIFREAFDVPVIGRFVLGQYWRRATEQERKEYLDLYADYVVSTYSDRFKGYRGVSFRVGETKPVGNQEQLVTTEVMRPGGQPPISVQWRVHNRAGSPKIVDVIAEGVSMLISQREEFGAIVSRNGGKVSALIEELRRRTKGGAG